MAEVGIEVFEGIMPGNIAFGQLHAKGTHRQTGCGRTSAGRDVASGEDHDLRHFKLALVFLYSVSRQSVSDFGTAKTSLVKSLNLLNSASEGEFILFSS
jgi:hypothetical protein